MKRFITGTSASRIFSPSPWMILSPIIAQLIQLAISRRRESLADTDGALLTRYPEGESELRLPPVRWARCLLIGHALIFIVWPILLW